MLLGAAHWGAFSGAYALFTYPIVAVSCAAMLIGSLCKDINISRNALLVRFGRMSSGLYVFHSLALRISDQLIHIRGYNLQGVLRIVCAAILTLILAAASYRWLESPFLRLKEKFSHIHSAPVLAAIPVSSQVVSQHSLG